MDHLDDVVFPIHEFDASAALHDVYCVFLRFDGAVDSAKLKNALWKVLDTGDWRKLGGRVRRRHKDGKLEIHVPNRYSSDRPPLNWGHESNEHSIADHPLAGKFPQDDSFNILTPPKDISQLALSPDFPRTIEDIVDKDVPQLSFKLMTFSDATLLATSFSHITWDAFGFLGLMRMVQLVLEGREGEIVPLLGAKDDILEELARPYRTDNSSPMVDPSSATPVPQSPPLPVEERIMTIPMDKVDRLRSRLQQEKSLTADDEFVRTDDMCLAWLVQQMVRADPTPTDVSLVNLLNARVLVPSIWKAKGVYPQNMFLLAPNVLKPEVASGTLEPIIASQQDCLARLAGRSSAGAYLATFAGNVDARIIALLLDASRSVPVLVNNLSKLTSRLDIDLSHAIVHHGGAVNGMRPSGTPTFFYLTNLSSPLMGRSLVMYGSVTKNACWMSGSLPKSAWDSIEAYLENL